MSKGTLYNFIIPSRQFESQEIKQKYTMESLILAQDERWRRA